MIWAAAAIALALPGISAAQLSPNGDSSSSGSSRASDSQGSDIQRASRDAASGQVALGSSDNTASYRPAEIVDKSPQNLNAGPKVPEDVREEIGARAIAARSPAAPSEFESYVSEIVDKPLRRFGANLLVPSARDFTAAPTTTVPTDYKINSGDTLVVSLTGSVQATKLQLTVDAEGRIFVPQVGAITVGGVRYGDVRSLISRQVSRYYRNFQVDVSIGQLHGITVYVTGFAATPGSYTISSLSTLVNAVLAAGGPSSGGSFRSIQLRRGGRLISDFDLYDLLLKGDKSSDAMLQNGDVIYIAPVKTQIAVIGSVNHEAIFEAGPRDTLDDVLRFAGGINTVADDSRILVYDPLRIKSSGWEELSPTQAQARIAKRGEIIRVLSAIGIARPLSQQPVLVTISGEVEQPGRYYVPAGTRLGTVLAKAGGLTAQASPYASVITRDRLRRQQQVSYERALRDLELRLTTQPLVYANGAEQLQPAVLEAVRSVVAQLKERKPDGRLVMNIPYGATDLPSDLILENNDTVYIPAPLLTVGVFGAVPSPASFAYNGKQTIGDVIALAGGVQKLGAKSEIFVVRANGTVISRRGHRGLMSERALPGDLIYVPIAAGRGLFWSRLRDITGILFNGTVAAATVSAITK
jgi:protein involved in polysaccharide export with SLBB domain